MRKAKLFRIHSDECKMRIFILPGSFFFILQFLFSSLKHLFSCSNHPYGRYFFVAPPIRDDDDDDGCTAVVCSIMPSWMENRCKWKCTLMNVMNAVWFPPGPKCAKPGIEGSRKSVVIIGFNLSLWVEFLFTQKGEEMKGCFIEYEHNCDIAKIGFIFTNKLFWHRYTNMLHTSSSLRS